MRLKTPAEIEIMAQGGRLLAVILAKLAKMVEPGMTGSKLDAECYRLIVEARAEPAFLGYKPSAASKPYPATICISVNDAIVHGLPNLSPFKPGDVVKLDAGLRYKGFYLDAAVTVTAGEASKKAAALIEVTETALALGIKTARPGNTLGDIGWIIQTHVEKNNFSVSESLTGHGIGRKLHEEPAVLNRGKAGEGDVLSAGMVLAIEPMVVAGKSGKVREGKDSSWRAVDGSLTAHFEHTVAITENGPRILTRI